MASVTLPRFVTGALAAALSLYGLYWVVAIIDAQIYRASFLLLALVLTFLAGSGRREAGGGAGELRDAEAVPANARRYALPASRFPPPASSAHH